MSEGTVVVVEDGNLPGVFTATGWEPPEVVPEHIEAERLVMYADHRVRESERRLYTDLWALADVLLWCEDAYGEEAYQLFPDTEFARKTYTNAMRIGRAFSDKSRRMDPEAVSFWLHGDVASLETWQADELLESYSAGEFNRAELRAEARRLRTDKKADELEQEAMDLGVDEWPTCPLCHGAAKVSPDQERAYFEREG